MIFTRLRSIGLGLAVAFNLVVSTTISHAQSSNVVLFGFTNTWKYNQTASYDGTNWTARDFDDSALPGGRGVLGLEDAANTFVTSRTNTVLALGRTTYYFRTHFSFTNNLSRLVSLTFSNIIDDGAVFYLNGVEISRQFMSNLTTSVSSATLASNHEATAVSAFTLSGPVLQTNLVYGDNVLAVEVHQNATNSTDIVFGLALSATNLDLTSPPLNLPLTPPAFGYSVANAFSGLGTQPFGAPVCLRTPPGETNRLFVVSHAGVIYVITNLASPNVRTFLSKQGEVNFSGESGMLGLAFHPGFATNGFFFVSYNLNTTTAQGTGLHARLSRFQVSSNNPNVAATNELILFTQKDPDENHNAGDLHFGPDGYLYMSLGDGGGGNDEFGNTQLINSNFFSAIMRLDVDVPFRPTSLMPNPHPGITNAGVINYRIPEDNPFIGRTNYNGVEIDPATVRTEFYAVGFRNPWRFSFDLVTGFLYCADVGQELYEEVSIVTKGGNYGWPYREGSHGGPRVGPAFEALTDPIHENPHGGGNLQGSSIIGGVVYRGTRFSQLYGAYLFSDYISTHVWMLRHDGTNTVPFQRLVDVPTPSAIGTDPSNGDVLIASYSQGLLYRLNYNTNSSTGTPIPPTLAQTGAFTNLTALTSQTQPLTPSPGLVPYVINTPFWSDNARKSRWFVPSPGTPMTFAPEGNWSFPPGLAWVKHFDLEFTNGVPSSARRLETRILVRNAAGTYGVTYRWGSSLTNANLIPDEGFTENLTLSDGSTTRTQVWRYPSRTECVICHTRVGGYGLGFNTLQLNCPMDYGNGPTNQLDAYSAAGWFTAPVTNRAALRALAHGTNTEASLEWRVRSYLAANCAQCHQPGGGGVGSWNGNITNLTTQAGLINGPLNDSLGNASNRVIVPGSLTHSVLLTRISTRGPRQMPPLGSSVLDTNAVNLLRAWITNGLAASPAFPDWQLTYFGDTNAPAAAPDFDADGDGDANYQEYLAGTDPTLASDAWRISLSQSGDQVRLNFLQPANRAFALEWATNINPPVLWQVLNPPLRPPTYPAQPVPVTFDDAITNAPFKMYRVKLTPP